MKKLLSHRFEIGIILSLIGTQIAVILYSVFPNWPFDLTNFVFLLSILLVVDYQQAFTLCIPKHPRIMLWILGYNIYALFMAVVAGISMFNQNNGLIYTLYVICFLIAICTNKREFDTDYFISRFWAVSGIFSILLFYLVTDGFTNISGQTIGTSLSSGADRLTLSVIAFMYICVALVYKAKNVFLLVLKVAFAIIAVYDVMACSRRGLMVALLIIIAYHFFCIYKGEIRRSSLVRNVLYIIGGIILVVAILNIFEPAREMITLYVERLVLAVNTYVGNTSDGVDAAASARNTVLNTVPQEYLSSDILTIIFGNGYGYRQLDVPYLQAFTDLGLIGGIWYLIIQFFYPVKALIQKPEDDTERLIKYISIITMTYNVYSGIPYNHYKFVSLILLVYVMGMRVRRETALETWGGGMN